MSKDTIILTIGKWSIGYYDTYRALWHEHCNEPPTDSEWYEHRQEPSIYVPGYASYNTNKCFHCLDSIPYEVKITAKLLEAYEDL